MFLAKEEQEKALNQLMQDNNPWNKFIVPNARAFKLMTISATFKIQVDYMRAVQKNLIDRLKKPEFDSRVSEANYLRGKIEAYEEILGMEDSIDFILDNQKKKE